MFKAMFGGKPENVPLEKLPQLHSVIDVIVAGRPARQVVVEAVSGRGIVTKECLGRVGESAIIVYGANAGRFRAQTKIASATATSTQFEIPVKFALIGAVLSEQKRSSVRMDTLVVGAWRSAPSGLGVGEFARATIRDISRGGCSLICARELKLGTIVEIQMPMRGGGAAPLTLLGEVMRHEPVLQSGKHSHGLRFQGMRPDEDQAIIDFINRKQTELRNRGLA
ncbi:MAG: PilZ domain-containing protein [Candidatus Baltobacteraceae bacterium]